jgi:hypothetical protein
MNSYYQLTVLIPSENVLDFETLIQQIEERTRLKFQIESASSAFVQQGQWKYHLMWEDAPHVEIESIEIADRFGRNSSQKESIRRCTRRISAWGDDDVSMVYFNTYVFVLEAFEQISGLVLFDPVEQTILNA